LRDQEAPSEKGALIMLNDPEIVVMPRVEEIRGSTTEGGWRRTT
jgi:hypothetical protein